MLRSHLFMRSRAVKVIGCPFFAALALHLADAQAGYRFDSSFLEIGGGRTSTAVQEQVSALSEGQLPGIYHVKVSINQKQAGQSDLRFIRDPQTPARSVTGLYPCVDSEFLLSNGVSSDVLQGATEVETGCVDLSGPLSGVSYDYDFNRQHLDIQIPQAYLGSIPFALRRKQWSEGEQVAFANYSFSGSAAQYDGKARQNQFGTLRSGINSGPWRLRNHSTWRKGTGNPGRWQNLETYAQRDLGNLMAIATVGEANTEGDLFDALPYRGVGVASDLDMLPDQAREFAPVVRGIANGRSRITIRQRGYVIDERWVPSGPFALTDLYPTSSNGDLEITVEGPDGQRQVYTQSFSSVPYMLREGQQSYSFYAGHYRPSEDSQQHAAPAFAQATLRRGLSGGTTVFGGTLTSAEYNAGLLGLAHDFSGLGAVSLDVTHARSTGVGAGKASASGQSYRFRYSKSLAATDTNFSLIGYRYSTSGYYSFSEALNSRENVQALSSYRNGHVKSNFTANISQQLGNYGGLYANLSKSAYWNYSKADTSLQVGYNFTAHNVSYSLGLGLNRGNEVDSRSVSLSISLPLGGPSGQRATFNTSQSSTGQASRTATLSGNALPEGALSYNVGVSQQTSDQSDVLGSSIAARYDGSRAVVHGAYNRYGNDQQLDYGIEGAVLAHRNSLIFSQPLGETNIIVATPGAANVSVLNKTGVYTNADGYTVVPSALPYRSNRISLDTESLPEDIDITQLVQEVAPTRGAFALVDFHTQRGRRVLLKLSDQFGNPAPFAASAQLLDVQGDPLSAAMVADNGRIFLSGVPDKARLQVSVNGQSWCAVALDLADQPTTGIAQIQSQCDRPATAQQPSQGAPNV